MFYNFKIVDIKFYVCLTFKTLEKYVIFLWNNMYFYAFICMCGTWKYNIAVFNTKKHFNSLRILFKNINILILEFTTKFLSWGPDFSYDDYQYD